jgi:hypothetical protein
MLNVDQEKVANAAILIVHVSTVLAVITVLVQPAFNKLLTMPFFGMAFFINENYREM